MDPENTNSFENYNNFMNLMKEYLPEFGKYVNDIYENEDDKLSSTEIHEVGQIESDNLIDGLK
jgi:hypothetical protein